MLGSAKVVLNTKRNGIIQGLVLLTPRQHVGWESVRYRGERYQVFGGFRGALFINLDNPIKGKS